MNPRYLLLAAALCAACTDEPPQDDGQHPPADAGDAGHDRDARGGRITVSADFCDALDAGCPTDTGDGAVRPPEGPFPKSWARRELDNASPAARTSVAVDERNRKLAIVAWTFDGASLLRCELDGSGCTSHSLTLGSPSGFGTAAIDDVNGKLLVLESTGVYRCELDGSACGFQAYPTVALPTGARLVSALDRLAQKLLVIAPAKLDTDGKPSGLALLRCELDGTGCDTTQVVADGAWLETRALYPAAASGQSLVFTSSSTVYRCQADGSACSATVLPVPTPGGVHVPLGRRGLLVIDEGTSARLNAELSLVTRWDTSRGAVGASTPLLDATRNQLLLVSDGPTLGRCDLALRSCRSVDLSFAGTRTGRAISAVLDGANARLWIVALNAADRPTLTTVDLRDAGLAPEPEPGPGASLQSDPSLAWADLSPGNAEFVRDAPAVSAIDEANAKLLVATKSDLSGTPYAIVRCDLNGVGCVTNTATGPNSTGLEVAAGTLLAFDGWSVSRCGLDGTNCMYRGWPGTTPFGSRRTVVDAAHNKIVGVVCGGDAPGGATTLGIRLRRCELDGQGCQTVDISNGSACPKQGSFAISADAVYVASSDDIGPTALTRCQLDGTACQYASVPAASTELNGALHVLVDAVTQKLLVLRLREARPQLLRCGLDLAGCTEVDVAAGQPIDSTRYAVGAIDPAHQRLLVLATTASGSPWLSRCSLDGSACTPIDLSFGGTRTAGVPSARIDAARNRLLLTTVGPSRQTQLFTLALQ